MIQLVRTASGVGSLHERSCPAPAARDHLGPGFKAGLAICPFHRVACSTACFTCNRFVAVPRATPCPAPSAQAVRVPSSPHERLFPAAAVPAFHVEQDPWTSSTIHRRHGLANGVHTPAVNNRARARTQAGCRAPPASPRRHKTPSTSTPPPSTGSPTSNLGAARTCAIPCVPSGRCDALSVPRGTRWPRGSLGPEWGSARSAG